VKTPTLALLLASSALFSACTYMPLDKAAARPVSQDYAAGGPLHNATAYVYGDRTVFELNTAPMGVFVKDETGADVAFERVGRYYRLDRVLANFTVWANGNSVTFAATTKPRSAPIALPTKPAPSSATALLELATKQLAEVRAELELNRKNPKQVKTELPAIHARLDEIEARVLTAATEIVNVGFTSNSTVFAPNEAIAKALINSAKTAQRINVRGRTDALIAGPSDARIALGRALAARTYLLNNGVQDNKINVFSQAAGGFAVANNTEEGRALNRRVEIEFVNSGITELPGHTMKLAVANKNVP
jgi:outer membrane protein OmpA-like peptidoglycan-associated protein